MSDDCNNEHVAKKPKTTLDLTKSTETAWEHFRNFLDSVSDDDEVGDLDELEELLEILKPHVKSPQPTCGNSVSAILQYYRTTQSLLPVLMSVAHYHLADAAILDTVDCEEKEDASKKAVEHLKASIEQFPMNAATWSVGANYGRMTKLLAPQIVCRCYQQAATCASNLRRAALQLLDGPDAVEDPTVKEWIELLFLDSIVDSEFIVEDKRDDTEKESNSVEEDGKEIKKEEEEAQEEDTEPDGYFSASRVEAISRFMASMLSSTAGQHDDALKQLQRFDLTHRLHPNIWNGVVTNATESNGSAASTMDPVVYTKDVLPPQLYERLCKVFAPNAEYWKESDYAHRGYFSYFMDLPSETSKDWRPNNLIEDVIVQHLLPLAKQSMSSTEKDNIVGAEWWVHTRPIQANLGHNLHFDTDEALLAQEQAITHPILSSVLYLTGNDNSSSNTSPAGATIVLDQTPDSDRVAGFCWISRPRDNSYMIFPGNLLHGVLPCPGDKNMSGKDVEAAIDGDNLVTFQFGDPPDETMPPKHRLTFMVGFWTRRVPDKMKERKLYGPCGAMPSPSHDHTWATEITKGYSDITNDTKHDMASQDGPVPLPKVYPAWEEIKHESTSSNGKEMEPLLELPDVAHRIDHRFFVKDAPQCFRDSLFEDNQSDE